MKSKTTNIFLAIIAINLTLITLAQFNIWPTTANANPTELSLDPNINYGLVPLNENGSINVNIASTTATMDVNISEIIGLTPGMHWSYEIDGDDYYALDIYESR